MEKSLFETFIEMFKKGGGIHINPKNKGKFTASAKRAGMSVQEFARHVLANKDKSIQLHKFVEPILLRMLRDLNTKMVELSIQIL